jgi:two-component system, LytTR family, response regulator
MSLFFVILAMEKHIPLSYRFSRGLGYVVFCAFAAVVFYQVTNLFRAEHGVLKPLFEGRFWFWAQDFVLWHWVFECLSMFVLFVLLRVYVHAFGLHSIREHWSALFVLFAKMLPLVLFSIFVFAPLTNGIRYLAYHYPAVSWAEYYPEYFFTWKMYTRYLVPVFFFMYAFLGYNVFRDYDDYNRARYKKLKNDTLRAKDGFQKTLSTIDQEGRGVLQIAEVLYFEVAAKKYYAYTLAGKKEIQSTLAELEDLLDHEQYFRANRKQIVNLGHFKSLAFWENDKYVLRLEHIKVDFIVQRARLKELKELVGLT